MLVSKNCWLRIYTPLRGAKPLRRRETAANYVIFRVGDNVFSTFYETIKKMGGEEKALLHFLAFTLADRQFALPLADVEQVAHAVELTPLAKAPPIVRGLINFHGRIIPVLSLRHCFLLPAKELTPEDHLVIVTKGNRTLALHVEKILGVLPAPEQDVLPPSEVTQGIELLAGVIRQEDGLLLVADARKILSRIEEEALEKALQESRDDKREEEGAPGR